MILLIKSLSSGRHRSCTAPAHDHLRRRDAGQLGPSEGSEASCELTGSSSDTHLLKGALFSHTNSFVTQTIQTCLFFVMKIRKLFVFVYEVPSGST